MPDSSSSHLRPEATALSLNRLTHSQTEAMSKLLDFLKDATNSSNRKDVGDRLSRLCLLSGTRGSGKTSLIMTAREHFEKISLRGKHQGEGDVNDLENDIWNLAEKVVWLNPISLDPMPRGTNLMAAILARVASVAAQGTNAEGPRRGLFDATSNLDRARHGLMNLRTEAIMGLEGNLDRRATGLDPETYATAAADAEGAKLELAQQLNMILGTLATGMGDVQVTEKVYVLPIDDVDIRPSRAIEILKLAYSLSVPRLFFIFLGSAPILDQALFYETQGEFSDLFGKSGVRVATVHTAIEEVSNEIASSLLRKLIPPGQRIELKNMAVTEALIYHPKGEGKTSNSMFAEILNKISWSPQAITTLENSVTQPLRLLNLIKSAQASAPESTFANLFGINEIIKVNNDDNTETSVLYYHGAEYEGANLLAGSPRQVSDLYHLFQSFIHKSKNSKNQSQANILNLGVKSDIEFAELFSQLVNNLTALIDEDAKLTVSVQDHMRHIATNEVRGKTKVGSVLLTSGGKKRPNNVKGDEEQQNSIEIREWHLNTSQLRLYHSTHDRLTFQAMSGDYEKAVASIVAHHVRKHHIKARVDDQSPYRQLSYQTRAGFKLLHDLMLLSLKGQVSHPISYDNGFDIAHTAWDDGSSEPMIISWPMAHWGSFWHLERFTAYWNLGLHHIRDALSQQAYLGDQAFIAALGLNWVSSAVYALTSRPGDEIEFEGHTILNTTKSGVGAKQNNTANEDSIENEHWKFINNLSALPPIEWVALTASPP